MKEYEIVAKFYNACGGAARPQTFFEEAELKNTDIPPFSIQRKQSGKAFPVNMGGVFQTVNRVLPKFRRLFRLHIQKHTAVAEDQAKQVLNQRNNRKPLLFVSVAPLQNAADLIPPEKILDSGRKTLFIFCSKCYTVHSADPLYVFGVLW